MDAKTVQPMQYVMALALHVKTDMQTIAITTGMDVELRVVHKINTGVIVMKDTVIIALKMRSVTEQLK